MLLGPPPMLSGVMVPTLGISTAIRVRKDVSSWPASGLPMSLPATTMRMVPSALKLLAGSAASPAPDALPLPRREHGAVVVHRGFSGAGGLPAPGCVLILTNRKAPSPPA